MCATNDINNPEDLIVSSPCGLEEYSVCENCLIYASPFGTICICVIALP